MSRTRRLAQVWSIDLAMSILVFIAALLITYGIITNAVRDIDSQATARQADDAARILAGEGYPAHWTGTTVLRAGILSDGQLSPRKAVELAELSDSALRSSLRMTDQVAVYATDEGGAIVPVFGTCLVGDGAVAYVPLNATVPAAGVGPSPHGFLDDVKVALNSTPDFPVYANASWIDRLLLADVLVLEGDITATTALSDDQISTALDATTARGITVIVIGDPGLAALGIVVNATDATRLTVQSGRGERIGLSPGHNLTYAGPTTIPTIETPQGEEIAAFEAILLTQDDEVAAATWLYQDARIWYFADLAGVYSTGEDFQDLIAVAAASMIDVPTPSCDAFTPPSDATQVARHDRIIAHHDEFLTLRVVTWREP